MKNARRLLACLVVCTMLIATLGTAFAFAGDEAVNIIVKKLGGVESVLYTVNSEQKTEGCSIAEGEGYAIAVSDTDKYVAEISTASEGIEVAGNKKSCGFKMNDILGNATITITFKAKKYVKYHQAIDSEYTDNAYTDVYVWQTENTTEEGNLIANPAAVYTASGNDYDYPEDKEFLYWAVDDGEDNLIKAEGNKVTFTEDKDTIDVYPVFKDTLAPVGQITVNLAQRTDDYNTGKRLNGDVKKTSEFTTTYEATSATWLDELKGKLYEGAAKLGFVANAVTAPKVDEEGKETFPEPTDIVVVTAKDAESVAYEEVSGIDKVAIYVQTLAADEEGNAPSYLTKDELAGKDFTELELKDGKYKISDLAAFPELVEDGIFAVYAKITDKAGNVAYICSEGVMLDMTAPTIDYPESECNCETCGGQDCANCPDCEDNDVGEDIDFWFGTGYTNLVVRDELSGIKSIEYRVWEKIGLDQTEYVSDTTLTGKDAIWAKDDEGNIDVYGNTEVFTEGKFRIMWPTWGFYEILIWVTDNAGNVSCYRIEVGDFPPIIIPVSVPIPLPLPIFIPDGKDTPDEPTTTPEIVTPDTGDTNVNIALIVTAVSLTLAGAVTVIAKKKRKVTE